MPSSSTSVLRSAAGSSLDLITSKYVVPILSIRNQAVIGVSSDFSQFRSLASSSECLFSLVNGDDMYVTFSVISRDNHVPTYIVWFSRIYLYSFVSLFIYIILNLFIAVVLSFYELLRVGQL